MKQRNAPTAAEELLLKVKNTAIFANRIFLKLSMMRINFLKNLKNKNFYFFFSSLLVSLKLFLNFFSCFFRIFPTEKRKKTKDLKTIIKNKYIV